MKFADGGEQDHSARGQSGPHRPHQRHPLLPTLQQRRGQSGHQDQTDVHQEDLSEKVSRIARCASLGKMRVNMFLNRQISAAASRPRNRLRESPRQTGAHIPDVPKARGPSETLPQNDLAGKRILFRFSPAKKTGLGDCLVPFGPSFLRI